jgi:hypothetical protein
MKKMRELIELASGVGSHTAALQEDPSHEQAARGSGSEPGLGGVGALRRCRSDHVFGSRLGHPMPLDWQARGRRASRSAVLCAPRLFYLPDTVTCGQGPAPLHMNRGQPLDPPVKAECAQGAHPGPHAGPPD